MSFAILPVSIGDSALMQFHENFKGSGVAVYKKKYYLQAAWKEGFESTVNLCSLHIHIRRAMLICLISENPGDNDA